MEDVEEDEGEGVDERGEVDADGRGEEEGPRMVVGLLVNERRMRAATEDDATDE